MRRLRRRLLTFGFVVSVWLLTCVAAQRQTTGSIEGRVTDPVRCAAAGCHRPRNEPEFARDPNRNVRPRRRVSNPSRAAGELSHRGQPRRLSPRRQELHRPARCYRNRGSDPPARDARAARCLRRKRDFDDGRQQLHERGHCPPSRAAQLRRHRAFRSRRQHRSRRGAGTRARAFDPWRDLGGKPVDHRWSEHDQRDQGLPGQGFEQRVHRRNRGQDRRVPGGVRPCARRRRQRDHEVRRKPVPWRWLPLLRLRRARERRRSSRGRLVQPVCV